MLALILFVACGSPDATAPPASEEAAPGAAIQPVAAASPTPDTTACDVSLFVYESDPAGLVVYDKPERGAAEVGRIPVDTQVQVTGIVGPWARLTATSDEGTALPGGWAGIELLTTNLRTPEEYGPSAKPGYRAGPEASGASKRIRLPIEWLTVKGCSGTMIQAEWEDAEGDTVSGWLELSAHCPSPNTTCS